jgi:hypothetical protein
VQKTRVLHPNQETGTHKLCVTDLKAKLHFLNSYLHWVRDGERDLALVLFSGDTCFQMNGEAKYQNNSFLMLIYQVLFKFDMSYITTATVNRRSIFL